MTVYLPHKDLVFVHIPKTAGSSIATWLKGNFDSEDRGGHLCYETYCNNYKRPSHHFVCVRNPYDRLWSWFNYVAQRAEKKLKCAPELPEYQELISPQHNRDFIRFRHAREYAWYMRAMNLYESGFKEFIMGLPDKADSLGPQPCSQIYGHHWVPMIIKNQCTWYDEQTVRTVLRMENLNSDFRQIQDWLGCNVPLPHRNKSIHRHYRDVYDSEMKLAMQYVYERDFDTFKYTF